MDVTEIQCAESNISETEKFIFMEPESVPVKLYVVPLHDYPEKRTNKLFHFWLVYKFGHYPTNPLQRIMADN